MSRSGRRRGPRRTTQDVTCGPGGGVAQHRNDLPHACTRIGWSVVRNVPCRRHGIIAAADVRSLVDATPLERELYPLVTRWLTDSYGCFSAPATDFGTSHGRIDVAGLRDLHGNLAGDTELVAVEVKRGRTPFLNAAGQARAYGVFADRIYLADMRRDSFTTEEVSIASSLDIGLLTVHPERRPRVAEVLTSPKQIPLQNLKLQIAEKMGFGQCSICRTIFKTRDGAPLNLLTRSTYRGSKGLPPRRAVARALEEERGLVWWLYEIDDRTHGRDTAQVRRYGCHDCLVGLFSHTLSD